MVVSAVVSSTAGRKDDEMRHIRGHVLTSPALSRRPHTARAPLPHTTEQRCARPPPARCDTFLKGAHLACRAPGTVRADGGVDTVCEGPCTSPRLGTSVTFARLYSRVRGKPPRANLHNPTRPGQCRPGGPREGANLTCQLNEQPSPRRIDGSRCCGGPSANDDDASDGDVSRR
jgi:hypothetical protein